MKHHRSIPTRTLRNILILFTFLWLIFFLVSQWNVEITLYLFGAH